MLEEVIWESERATESGGLCLTAKAVPMKRSRPASAQVASASLRLIRAGCPCWGEPAQAGFVYWERVHPPGFKHEMPEQPLEE